MVSISIGPGFGRARKVRNTQEGQDEVNGKVTNRTRCFYRRTGSFVWSIGASYNKLLHSDGV